MAKQTINIGSQPNDKTGDPLRAAFTKINANFTELYAGGAAGATGPHGATGPQGASGVNGIDGATGAVSTVLSTVTKTTSSGQTIELDLTKLVNKITPTGSGSTSNGVYHLADGVEGQILHIVSAGPEYSGNEYTGIDIDNARWGAGNSINEGVRYYWLVFYDTGYGRRSSVTLTFTDGYWNLPHGNVD